MIALLGPVQLVGCRSQKPIEQPSSAPDSIRLTILSVDEAELCHAAHQIEHRAARDPSIGEVQLSQIGERVMTIDLDAAAMAKFGVVVADVTNALHASTEAKTIRREGNRLFIAENACLPPSNDLLELA